MRNFSLGMMIVLGTATAVVAQGSGQNGHGGLPGSANGPHFGDKVGIGGPGQVPGAAAPGADRASSQSGTGHLGFDTVPSGNAFGRLFPGWLFSGNRQKNIADPDENKDASSRNKEKRKEKEDHDADDQGKLTGPARALQERLAAIDHMRDMALKSGNLRLLQEADVLEAKARAQFSFQMEHGNRAPNSVPPPPPAAPLPAATTEKEQP